MLSQNKVTSPTKRTQNLLVNRSQLSRSLGCQLMLLFKTRVEVCLSLRKHHAVMIGGRVVTRRSSTSTYRALLLTKLFPLRLVKRREQLYQYARPAVRLLPRSEDGRHRERRHADEVAEPARPMKSDLLTRVQQPWHPRARGRWSGQVLPLLARRTLDSPCSLA